jgi:hypothetical protein
MLGAQPRNPVNNFSFKLLSKIGVQNNCRGNNIHLPVELVSLLAISNELRMVLGSFPIFMNP